jgi:hypothetical protein
MIEGYRVFLEQLGDGAACCFARSKKGILKSLFS